MYAIIESCGKQYKVREGDSLALEKIPFEPGETVVVDRVLAVGEGEDFKIGTPLVEGARVTLTVQEHGKGKKIIVFKYKPKKNYRRKQGHRQPFTRVRVAKIEA